MSLVGNHGDNDPHVSAPRTISGVRELTGLVGEHLGFGPWHVIDQRQIDRFADATYDHQWIHTDPDRARNGPFGTTIAHGFFTAALIPALVGQIYHVSGVRLGINYGLNRLRFPAPVPVGARIRAGVQIVSVENEGEHVRLTDLVTIEIDGAEKPACVAETITIFVMDE